MARFVYDDHIQFIRLTTDYCHQKVASPVVTALTLDWTGVTRLVQACEGGIKEIVRIIWPLWCVSAKHTFQPLSISP